MKKTKKGLLAILLTCLMVCMPVAQAMAAVTIDASAGIDSEVLFPGDALTNASLPIIKDGADVSAEGGWTNTESETAYLAELSEDGMSIVLSEAGKVLVVEYGTSSRSDGSDDAKYHSEAQNEDETAYQDVACYPAGDTVKLKADSPKEGMVFAGWSTDSGDVWFEDASNEETVMTMPSTKTTVTATYKTVETEAPADDANTGGEAPADDANAGGEAPADDTNTGGEAPADDANTGGEAPADDANTGGEAPADDANTGGEAPADDANTGGEAPAGDVNTGGVANGDSNITLDTKTPVDMYSVSGTNGTQGLITNDNAIDIVIEDSASLEAGTYDAGGQDGGEGVPETYSVTVNNGQVTDMANATTDESGVIRFAAGAIVTVTADSAPEGEEFAGWFVENNTVTPAQTMEQTTTFEMPAADVIISATYAEAQLTEPETTEPTEAPTEPETTEPTEAPTEPETTAPTETPQLDDQTYEVVVENGAGSGFYKAGDTVTVEAQEQDGLAFQSWATSSSDVQVTDPNAAQTTFVMPEEGVVVTAEYATNTTYKVTMTDGTMTDSTGTPVAEAAFAQGIRVTIKANEAPAGQQFAGWTGTYTDAAGVTQNIAFENPAASETAFIMPAFPVAITAAYSDITYTVTVANGTLTSNGATQDAADASKWTVKAAQQVTITANANPAGQVFTKWTVTDAQGADVAASLGIDVANSTIALASVSQNLNFKAQYEGIPYSITVNDGIANYDTAVSGTDVTIVADEAPEGMEFDYWTVDSGNVSLADSLSETTSFTMPAANVTVSASYKLKEYTLTVENGTASKTTLHMGDAVTISSNYPASGKEFDKWVATSGNVSFEDSSRWKTSFAMPASDVTVKATYKDGPSTNDNRILDLIAGGEYYTESTIKFTASGAGMGNTNPNPGDYRYRPSGYQIGNVTGSWNSSPYTTSMSIKATGEYTLKVTFAKDVYDGSNWVADGTTDTKSVTFRVITKAEGVATGDETPLAAVIAIAAVSCVVFIILLVVFLKRRKNR